MYHTMPNQVLILKQPFKLIIRIVMKINQEQTFLLDYLNALAVPTHSLIAYLSQQLRSVEQTFDYKHKQSMEIIEQEETDRQYQEQEPHATKMKKEFNSEIRNIIKIKNRIQEILNVYKVEIKSMAKSIIQLQEELHITKKDILQLSRKNSKAKSSKAEPSRHQPEKQEDLKIRLPPEPVKEVCNNCVKMEEDKSKWKTLSNKIDEFKKKNNIFEVQLRHKQLEIKNKEQQIQKLKQKVSQLEKTQSSDRQDEQRKKIKKENTNLRGEKVLLNNQMGSLKKQLAEKIEISNVQDIEIKKLRLQIDNLNSSLNWHITNLNELRNSHKRGLSQQHREQTEKAQNLLQLNKLMSRTLQQQEQLLQAVNSKTKKLQEGLLKNTDRYQKKVSEMQSILEDKNETIIKLKTSNKNQKPNSYQSDMIKVLNKKLSEKEELIRNLQEQIESISS